MLKISEKKKNEEYAVHLKHGGRWKELVSQEDWIFAINKQINK